AVVRMAPRPCAVFRDAAAGAGELAVDAVSALPLPRRRHRRLADGGRLDRAGGVDPARRGGASRAIPYTSPVTRKAELVGLALVLLLVTLSFADLLSTKRVLFNRDVSRMHVPERVVLRDVVRDGFPFWNPRYAAGQP